MRHASKTTVTAVLTAYRRRSNLPLQLAAIENQSHPVNSVMIWENGPGDHIEVDSPIKTMIASSSTNLGVWSRFVFALNADSDFVWIIDDDTIPGTRWLENALTTFGKQPGLIGSRGLRFHSKQSYLLYDEFGPNNPSSEAKQVDIVGHNWILPRDWLAFFFLEFPNKFPNNLAGEDIHLSYAIQKHLNLGTFVPPHPVDQQEVWGELEHLSKFSGRDQNAISSNRSSLKKFEDAFSHYIKLGFTPLVKGGVFSNLAGRAVRYAPGSALSLAQLLRISK